MVAFFEKFVWSGLLSLGLQFLYIGFRVRFDRVYAYFGVSLFLLAVIFFHEAGPIPALAFWGSAAAWEYVSRLAALAFFPIVLRFVFYATRVFQPRLFSVLCALDAGLACLFTWSLLAGRDFPFSPSPGPLSASPSIGVELLLPFILLNALVFHSLARGIRLASRAERKHLILLAAGWGAFGLGVGAEMAFQTSGTSWKGIAMAGLGGFVSLAVFFLMQRFLSLHRANRNTLRQLAAAYASLGESVKLKELGASAASITHEIRNYAATLKGNALLLGRSAGKMEYREEVDRIRATAEKMEVIASDVAVYARTSLPLQKEALILENLLRHSVSMGLPDHAAKIRIHPCPSGLSFEGDGGKLEQVFVNFFRNSIEAGADRIDVRSRVLGNRLIVVVEDDGAGCHPDDLEHIAKPFFSKKASGGTGLGCSIAESILKSHGATFRCYSKNVLEGQSGLILNLVFPLGTAKSLPNPFSEMPVICLENQSRGNLIQPMIHLGIHPVLLPIEESLANGREARDGSPVFLDRTVAVRHPEALLRRSVIMVGENRAARRLRPPENAEDAPFLFTEESLAKLIEGRFEA